MTKEKHSRSSKTQRHSTTPDFEILRYEAKQLRDKKHLLTLKIVEEADLPSDALISHCKCLDILAKRYGYESYNAFHEEQKLFQQYCETNRVSHLNGSWHGRHDRKWRKGIFDRQCIALIEAAKTGFPLAVTSKKRGVNFEGFHFSEFLYRKLFRGKSFFLDFSNLEAMGCYLNQTWVSAIESFRNAQLTEAKFYRTDAEGAIGPGIHAYKLDAFGANLTGADLRDSYLRGSNFYRATLYRADLSRANIYDCTFDRSEGCHSIGEIPSDIYLSWVVFPKTHSFA